MSAGDGSKVLPPAAREGEGAVNTAKKKQENASTGASAATIRALSARMFAFYFRAPVKAFFRARVDYMGYARAINPRIQAGEPWSYRQLSPFILAHAIRTHGWSFIPNQVLPPLLANTAVGAVLYTTYLNTLGLMHEPSSRATKRVYPPPPLETAFKAGFVAGTVQSLLAAPLDALQVRFQAKEMMEGRWGNMWQYAHAKTKEIGARGVFAGWTLSFVRDSIGFGAFFAAFEFVKGQCFYSFVSNVYGFYDKLSLFQKTKILGQEATPGRPEIKPHYMLEPTFILMAGAAASIAQSVVQHPITRIQDVHYGRLEWIDSHRPPQAQPPSATEPKPAATAPPKRNAFSMYASAYRKTFKECAALARRSGGLRAWLYKDFLVGTLRQVPSTSAGLIAFEVIRRKYAMDEEVVRIHKDGYDILLV
ncbi:uncharacterized protein LTR77_009957 [Saxophila tyrrhenica]|uniref:Mitochondrial carrier protein n=1 Tax=Saxophila tyrrhenica TaxID=1690608 RepID=A0AAV9NX64_9PEZI|nr:hypothetical protein LTR77_009957 [Saxophila tyrrhenica]